MCSTPKSSGTARQVRRYVDDGADYASYSQMLRNASNRIDQQQRKADQEKQTDAGEDSDADLGSE